MKFWENIQVTRGGWDLDPDSRAVPGWQGSIAYKETGELLIH